MSVLPVTVWQITDSPERALSLGAVVDDARTLAPALLCERLASGLHPPDLLLFHRWDRALAEETEPLARVWLDPAADPGEIVVDAAAGPEALAHAFASAMGVAAVRALHEVLRHGSEDAALALRSEAPALDRFALHFQPQWSIDGDRLIGAEALLRWHGLAVPDLKPEAIVALAETHGTLAHIGDWVVDCAAWHLNEWLPFWPEAARLALNVSPAQLDDRTFVQRIDRILVERGLNASAFELELPADALSRLGPRRAAVVASLADLGFTFALDRLGAGLIDRHTIEWLPAQSWKLDRALVARAAEADAARLIETITRLARDLGIRTIAVGVEEAAQQARLAALGCDALQGFVLAEALPAAEFGALLVAHAERTPARRRLSA
jgi:EAL domain-containing protein (putative c-di-GMP-specific phosphodiesterase class I)